MQTHCGEEIFRERVRKPKVPEKAYAGSSQHPEASDGKDEKDPF